MKRKSPFHVHRAREQVHFVQIRQSSLDASQVGRCLAATFFHLILTASHDMSAEFDDVLTNQPVVIDNVCRLAPRRRVLLLTFNFVLDRALALSKLGLLARIIRNAFSRLCASPRLGS